MGDLTIKPASGGKLDLRNNGGTAKVEVNDGGGIDITLGGGATDDLNIDSNTLDVESDTNSVGIGTNDPAQQLHISGATPIIQLTDTDTGADSLITASNGTGTLKIQVDNGSESADSTFEVDVDGSQRFKVDATGDATITDGDLIIGTAGHGIDFNATSEVSGMTSEVLDDYEEGTWTAVNGDFGTFIDSDEQISKYIKIGKLVYIYFRQISDVIDPDGANKYLTGLPFALDGSQPMSPMAEQGVPPSGNLSAMYLYDTGTGRIYLNTDTGGFSGVKCSFSATYITSA